MSHDHPLPKMTWNAKENEDSYGVEGNENSDCSIVVVWCYIDKYFVNITPQRNLTGYIYI